MFMMSKTTAFKLALFSAALCVLFAYWRVYVCLLAAFLLLLIFDGIWIVKTERDRRLSALHDPAEPEPAIGKTSHGSTHLVLPRPLY